MWTVDSQCSRCKHRKKCDDRLAIIPALNELANARTAADPEGDSPGDGTLIMACRDFAAE